MRQTAYWNYISSCCKRCTVSCTTYATRNHWYFLQHYSRVNYRYNSQFIMPLIPEKFFYPHSYFICSPQYIDDWTRIGERERERERERHFRHFRLFVSSVIIVSRSTTQFTIITRQGCLLSTVATPSITLAQVRAIVAENTAGVVHEEKHLEMRHVVSLSLSLTHSLSLSLSLSFSPPLLFLIAYSVLSRVKVD